MPFGDFKWLEIVELIKNRREKKAMESMHTYVSIKGFSLENKEKQI